MFDYLFDFLISFVTSSGWVFFPLFILGLVSWYLVMIIYTGLSLLRKNLQDFFTDLEGVKKNTVSMSPNVIPISNKSDSFTESKKIKKTSDTSLVIEWFWHHHKKLNKNEVRQEDYEKFVYRLLKSFYRDVKTISVLAGVAPLLGLLGTVSGMMNTFEVISLYGNSNPILMADGISEAMLTTQIGLLIAFPLLLIATWLRSKLNDLQRQLVKNLSLTLIQ